MNMSKHRKLRRCLRIREKNALGAKKGIGTPPLPEKKRWADWKKDLQICGEARESRKRPALVVGKNPNGKTRPNMSLVLDFAAIGRTDSGAGTVQLRDKCRSNHPERVLRTWRRRHHSFRHKGLARH
jgi:hypothetical protein